MTKEQFHLLIKYLDNRFRLAEDRIAASIMGMPNMSYSQISEMCRKDCNNLENKILDEYIESEEKE